MGTAPILIAPKKHAANSGESSATIITRRSICTPSFLSAFPVWKVSAATSLYDRA
jgi:hypothetical protein